LATEKIRWTKPENLHLTLKFFGETPIEKIDIINKELRKITTHHLPFTLQLEKTGIFGSRYKPRVIWFGVGKNVQLVSFAHDVLMELDKAGFSLDRQNFVPHLSLGRIKAVRNKVTFQQVINRFKEVFVQEVKVSSISLFESNLLPSGAVYKQIEEYKLGE
jgi:2'-5' RNA ligase